MRHNLVYSVPLPFLLAVFLLTGCDKDSNPVLPSDDVSNTNFTASEIFQIQVNHSTETALRVEAINGEVRVTGKSGTDVIVISGRKSVGSESVADAEAHLDDLEVSVSTQGNEVIVETSQPSETYGRSYIVDYDISMPTDMTLDVHAINGNVRVDSTTQQVTVEATNWEVILNDVWSPCTVDLTNGEIEAELRGPQTTESAVVADLTLVNGNLNLNIPQSVSAFFSANVTNGSINIDNLNTEGLQFTLNSVTGTLGNGEGSIQLRTTNGSINVTGF